MTGNDLFAFMFTVLVVFNLGNQIYLGNYMLAIFQYLACGLIMYSALLVMNCGTKDKNKVKVRVILFILLWLPGAWSQKVKNIIHK